MQALFLCAGLIGASRAAGAAAVPAMPESGAWQFAKLIGLDLEGAPQDRRRLRA